MFAVKRKERDSADLRWMTELCKGEIWKETSYLSFYMTSEYLDVGETHRRQLYQKDDGKL